MNAIIPGRINELTLGWLSHFNPPDRVSHAEWCEANIELPAGQNARPGPLRFTSFQKGIVDALADPSVEIVVLMLASQVGKSLAIDSDILYRMACEPGPMLVVYPANGDAEEYITDRLDPLIRLTPAVRALIGGKRAGGRKGGGDSKSHKLFPGGSLNIASSRTPSDLARKTIRYLYCDEIDRFVDSAGKEGDPISLAIKRTHTFAGKGRKIVLISTPSLKTKSKIAKWYARTNRQKYFVLWPCCGVHAPFSFSQLNWNPGQPHSTCLVCEHCGAAHDESARLSMVRRGEWLATNPDAPVGIVGFQASELVSEFSSLAQVVSAYESAKTPEEKQTFTNTVLAEPSDDEAAEVDLHPSELQRKAEPIRPPYAAEFEYVTCGVDVQGNRVEVSYVAHAAENVSAVLDHVVIPGDTSAPVLIDGKLSPYSVWSKLDQALGVSFPRADRAVLAIAATIIDSNFNTQNVGEFVQLQRRKQRIVFAGKGMGGFDRPWVKEGAKLRGLTKQILIGVDPIKLHLQKRLDMPEPGPGFIHLPDHLEADYFEGLASEKLMNKYVRGQHRPEYVKEVKRNESFDCLVYATAATKLVPINRRTAARAGHPAPGAQPQRQTLNDVLAELNANLNSR